MDGESINSLERIIAQSMYKEAAGVNYGRDSRGDMAPLIYEPSPEPVTVNTLTGFADYIKSNVDALDLNGHFIIVESPFLVILYSALHGQKRRRDSILVAKLDEELDSYPFGQYQEIEPFTVSLSSLFEETEDRDKLIRYVSKVRGGTAFTLSDDGVTQVAEVSKGVSGALTEKESAPKIVSLKPYRTFRDLPQPESPFLFRLKLIDSEEHTVWACLYEADGGRWRNDALHAIKAFLAERVSIAIIA